MKRIGLFLLVNILVLTTIVIMTTLLGVNRYITAHGLDYSALLIFAAIIGFSGAFISLMLSKRMAKSMLRVQVLDPRRNLSAGERRLVDMVHDMCRRAGIRKMPEVGIYPSPEVNAFATGPSRNNSLVAVSSGLLAAMDAEAVEGVLAHEVAHVANGDMVTMTLVQGVINTFVVFLSRIIAYIIAGTVREEVAGIVHIVSIIALQIMFSILGSIAVMAYSRHREFAADRGGAQLAGREKMIRALRALRQNVQRVDNSEKAFQTLKISGGKGGSLANLFASHPSLDDRIRRLEAM